MESTCEYREFEDPPFFFEDVKYNVEFHSSDDWCCYYFGPSFLPKIYWYSYRKYAGVSVGRAYPIDHLNELFTVHQLTVILFKGASGIFPHLFH
jgi:hypothetical protein